MALTSAPLAPREVKLYDLLCAPSCVAEGELTGFLRGCFFIKEVVIVYLFSLLFMYLFSLGSKINLYGK